MRQLTVKMRKFVLELACGPSGYGSLVRAAKAAGYGTAKSTESAIKVSAHRVLYDPRVQEALREVGGKLLRTEAFLGINVLVAIARDPTHKDRLKAAVELMNRGGFAAVTHHTVTVEHKIDYTKQALEELATFRRLGVARERLEEIFGRDGLYHLEQQLDAQPKLIEGEVVAAAD
jgi:hypothetical protein